MTRKMVYIHMKYPDGSHATDCKGCRGERDAALAAVKRVRAFVDGFAERGGGKLDPGDELWIMAIRRELDGQ